jgi:ABC-type transport system involved in multi-copper enzyme maturation permease subunit
MMNYIKSELYRTLKNRSLKIMMAIYIGLLTAMVLVLYYYRLTDVNFRYANTRFTLGMMYMSMTVIMILTMVISAIVDDSEYKNHTIKHSVAFGIDRKTIFFGKFLVQVIVCVVIYVVILAYLTGISYLFLVHSNVGEVAVLARISLGCLTCLIAGLTISYVFIMINENQMIGATWGLIIIMGLPIICNLLGRKVEIVEKMGTLLPYNLIASDGKIVTSSGMDFGAAVSSSIVGAVWTVAFLLIGIVLFQKKEIK